MHNPKNFFYRHCIADKNFLGISKPLHHSSGSIKTTDGDNDKKLSRVKGVHEPVQQQQR